ncbi:MAG: acyl-CoA dehydrogenase family protein [Balneolaceae bacterium]
MSLQLFQSIQVGEDFRTFLSTYKNKLESLFTERNEENELASQRGLPPYVLRQILECNPLSTFIPEDYGGRGAKTYEALSMLETTSYQSLPLSLMMGINGALFLQPLGNYAEEDVKKTVFKRFLDKKNMGGLMITEPDFGSDALKMQTAFTQKGQFYHVSGTKHWAGLTGWADYWLITAREMDEKGELGRDIGFFIHETNRGGIEVQEYYKNLGLHMLPYGRNKIDIKVPISYRLQPKSTGVKMMLDTLHRSRLQFPGMGTGYLKRLLDEALQHCRDRFVGGMSLINYDQVRERLAQMQSYFTVSSAMSYFTSREVPLDQDTSRMDLTANSIKSVTTDYMHSAAQSFMQLVGAKGYKLDHIAGRSLVDSRPFQIFEGSNDILYQQITESVIKMMKKMKVRNLYEFLNDYKMTEHAADYFKELLNFEIDYQMAQRKMVQMGRAISRIVSLEMTLRLGESGFNSEMISNSVKVLQNEVNVLVSAFSGVEQAEVLENYTDDSSWLKFLPSHTSD